MVGRRQHLGDAAERLDQHLALCPRQRGDACDQAVLHRFGRSSQHRAARIGERETDAALIVFRDHLHDELPRDEALDDD